MSPGTARRIAWVVLGGYFLLGTAGFVLQVLSGMNMLDFMALGYSFLGGLTLLAGFWSSIGVLIIYKQPGHPVGWIMLFALIGLGFDSASFGFLFYFGDSSPVLESISFLAQFWLSWSGFSIFIICFTFLFLLFPTGDSLSPRWGKLRWIAVGALVGYLVSNPLSPDPVYPGADYISPVAVRESTWILIRPFLWIALAVVLTCALAAGYSLVLRFRRSRGVERQQLKWFVFAVAPFPFYVVPTAFVVGTGSTGPLLYVGVSTLLLLTAAMPVAIAFAILKYRLYDIDIIIRRTIVYVVVTGFLVLTYFASVGILQSLLSNFAGQRSPIAIVGSTLLIAALFQPIRRRVQASIDQRFYRRRYDAQRLLDRFGAELRNEVDPEAVADLLLEVVQESLQPSGSSLWLRGKP